jgi:hypothetical protein
VVWSFELGGSWSLELVGHIELIGVRADSRAFTSSPGLKMGASF